MVDFISCKKQSENTKEWKAYSLFYLFSNIL